MKHFAVTATPEEELHWIALALVPGLGARRAHLLVETLGSARVLFSTPARDLERAGAPPAAARSIAAGSTFDDAVNQRERAVRLGVSVIPASDSRYPPLLREIVDPPPVLYAHGDTGLLQRVMVAIVGTRRATTYGKAVTERLSADLVRAGVVVVSGMARGIDTRAHRAALDAGGPTVAVFGCGADVVYPTENARLAEEIAAKGLVLTEFPLGTPAYPQNFPSRNRIVSGMSRGVVVVEGAEYSGSTITARLAAEQGRELFAVPGNITSELSWGPNTLIKQGAKLVQDWHDIIEELPEVDRTRLAADGRNRILEAGGVAPPQQGELDLGPNTPAARDIVGVLSTDQPTPLDLLFDKLSSYSSSEIVATLFELEMLGLVRQLPGRSFVKLWR